MTSVWAIQVRLSPPKYQRQNIRKLCKNVSNFISSQIRVVLITMGTTHMMQYEVDIDMLLAVFHFH